MGVVNQQKTLGGPTLDSYTMAYQGLKDYGRCWKILEGWNGSYHFLYPCVWSKEYWFSLIFHFQEGWWWLCVFKCVCVCVFLDSTHCRVEICGNHSCSNPPDKSFAPFLLALTDARLWSIWAFAQHQNSHWLVVWNMFYFSIYWE